MNGFPNIHAFPVLEKLVKTFPKAEVFLVGGAVRDIILDTKVTDFDFLVCNVSSEDLESFLAKNGSVVFAGSNFGVWKFREIGRPAHEVYDIALPRTEFSMHNQGLYRDFNVQTDPHLPVEKDLHRRDFTINAMAYNLQTETIIDPHNGQADLKAKLLRTVGDPEERFTEDFSRMIRALRFSLQLNFDIEAETRSTIKKMIVRLNDTIQDKRVVPYEIISEEFLKSLLHNPRKAIEVWDEYGALAEIAPELLTMKGCPQPDEWHTEGDVWTHTMLALDALYDERYKATFGAKEPSLDLILAVLFHDVGKPYTMTTPERDGVDRIRFNEHDIVGADIARRVLERLHASAPPDIGVDVDAICWAIRHHMLLVHGKPERMKETTIERYFFSERWPSDLLIHVMYVDGLATLGPEGTGYTNNYEALDARMQEIKKTTGSHGRKLVKPLINGHDIIQAWGSNPGRHVGIMLEKVRQKQLSGDITSKKEALAFVQSEKKESYETHS